MFERFHGEYASGSAPVPAGAMWRDEHLAWVDGYAAFASEFAGVSFRGGLYRVHDARTGPQALTLVAEGFPAFAARVRPFGYDWLGRQFAIDFGRIVGGQPQVLLLEPGTGEALEIPASFASFHDEELTESADAALAEEFFEAWSAGARDSLPLGRDQCVGYRVPLFLGGQDAVENLELSDLAVYWSVCAQLRQGVQPLPPETVIEGVTFEDGERR